jgi:GT2 family glycosyltransferase
VVPTCGRPALLQRCLDALERQSLPRERFEIVVVEDLRRDGPAAARNRGLRRARAPIIAFTDDDCVPRPDWLEKGLLPLRDAKVAVVCGRIVMPIPATPTDYERDASGLERSEFVTANCFCRSRVLHDIGGFDERFRLAWREDSDLHFRLLEAGARIGRAPDALVEHPVRPARWGASLAQQRKIMFDALLFKKHRRLYRERIRRAPRWDYYLTTGALLAGVLYPALWLVWLALTARFCLQRLQGTSHAPAHLAELAVTSLLIPPLAVFWRLLGALRYRVAFA